MSEPAKRPVGLTRDVGWEIGVRRTFPMSLEEAWRLITSPEGIRIWLGEGPAFSLEKGDAFSLDDGTTCEIRVFKTHSHLRLRRKPADTQQASTIQLRVLENGNRSVIAFHEENLASAEQREARRAHFAAALDKFEARLEK